MKTKVLTFVIGIVLGLLMFVGMMLILFAIGAVLGGVSVIDKGVLILLATGLIATALPIILSRKMFPSNILTREFLQLVTGSTFGVLSLVLIVSTVIKQFI